MHGLQRWLAKIWVVVGTNLITVLYRNSLKEGRGNSGAARSVEVDRILLLHSDTAKLLETVEEALSNPLPARVEPPSHVRDKLLVTPRGGNVKVTRITGKFLRDERGEFLVRDKFALLRPHVQKKRESLAF